VEGPAVCVPLAGAPGYDALPFVISTEAQRSGEICGFPALTVPLIEPQHRTRQSRPYPHASSE
jgi:hypothetical protein